MDTDNKIQEDDKFGGMPYSPMVHVGWGITEVLGETSASPPKPETDGFEDLTRDGVVIGRVPKLVW